MKNILPRLPHVAGFAGLLLSLAGPAHAAPGPFTLAVATSKTMTTTTLAAAQHAATLGQVSADKHTLTFRRKTIRLVAVCGPENDMLSYRIAGLRNPTLNVPGGATLQVLFVNTDDDMSHNLRFGSVEKRYPAAMSAYDKASVGTPLLPHKSETAMHAQAVTIYAPQTPGVYAYLCTEPGHAEGGMGGKIIVR